jgi:hypothetical protein
MKFKSSCAFMSVKSEGNFRRECEGQWRKRGLDIRRASVDKPLGLTVNER